MTDPNVEKIFFDLEMIKSKLELCKSYVDYSEYQIKKIKAELLDSAYDPTILDQKTHSSLSLLGHDLPSR